MRAAFRRDGAIAVSGALTGASLEEIRRCTGRPVFARNNAHVMRSPDRHLFALFAIAWDVSPLADLVRVISGSKSLGAIFPEGGVAFRSGDYTLLHDELLPAPRDRVVAFLVLDDWDTRFGGDIVWVKRGETLLRIAPAKNTLYIVREERGSRMFVKYVNHRAGKRSLRIIPVA